MQGALKSLVATGLIAGVFAFGVARACTGASTAAPLHGPRVGDGTVLVGHTASYTFHPGSARITLRSLDRALVRDVEMALVVDGLARPLEIDTKTRVDNEALGVTLPLDLGDARADAVVTFRVDRASDALVATLTAVVEDTLGESPDAEPGAKAHHALALAVEIPTEGRTSFVSDVGEIADLARVSGRIALIDAEPHPIGVVSARGMLEVAAVEGWPKAEPAPQADDEAAEPIGTPMRISATSPTETLEVGKRGTTDLRLAICASTARAWGTLHHLAGNATARVTGVVTGTHERARVFGLDLEGTPQVRATADENGRFVVDVPKSVAEWYAAIDVDRMSAPTRFVPGTLYDLKLDVSPGGELHVRIADADGAAPITARLVVHGIDGTLDPSFGPDYRASGAGPIIDSLRGDVVTPLPAGRYRVAATKGIEWSIDAKIVDVASGRSVGVDLTLRHVVSTPGVVGCDLHVHARPSFDTPVSPEDRVLSLVAAGVDFAVPSEHNLVGDYGPMLATLDLTHDLAYVSGVEVTTYNPRFGHFGVFPYPLTQKVPPYRGTSIGAVMNASRRGDPTRIVQVNHPRLTKGIGYFEIFHFDPKAPHPPKSMRTDFDTLEVYNGYDLGHPERVDAVMRDWFSFLERGKRYIATGSSDSHRIQYQWAGYPRTMVAVGSAAGGDKGAIDTAAVIASLKKGHASVTSGPIVELGIAGACAGVDPLAQTTCRPGDEMVTGEETLRAHVSVRAAPWVDVTSVEIVVGGRVVKSYPVESRPTKLGAEAGTLEEAAARTVRFDQDVALAVGPTSTWVLAIARGTRRLDDILPFMPVPPLGFTNPIWVTRP